MLKINGLSEKDLGIVIAEPSAILGRAPLRFEEIEIEGADGTRIETLGYQNSLKSWVIQIVDLSKIDLILSTFTGRQRIDYKGRYAWCTFLEGFNLERMVFLQRGTINFSRDPFWIIDEDFESIYKNDGNVVSKPIIKLSKTTSSEVTIRVNDVQFKYTFGVDPYVEIDCESKNASYNNLLRNMNLEIDWSFPELNPGINDVEIISGDAIVTMKRRSRWL